MGKMEVKVTDTHNLRGNPVSYGRFLSGKKKPPSVTATDSSEEKQPYLSNESRFAIVVTIKFCILAIADSRYIAKWALTLVTGRALAFHIHWFRGRMLQGNSTHKLIIQLWKEMSRMEQVFFLTWEMEIISYL